MVLGTKFSKPSLAAATWFQEITGTPGSAAAQRHHRHTMSLFDPKQMPPNKEMHPAPNTISQVSPYLILPYPIIFCLLPNSEFLWGWRQHNMLQLLITPCSTAVRLYVMKSSPALTPISGTDPLCKFLLMPCYFIPFTIFQLFQRPWEAFEKKTAWCLATAAFQVNYFGLLALLQNNKHDNN